MNWKSFFSLFKDSLYAYLKNPVLIVPTGILLILLVAFSNFSVFLNKVLTSEIQLKIWLVVYTLISIIVVSFLLSALIGISGEAIRSKAKLKNSFHYARKYEIKNLVLIVIFLVSYNIINFVTFHSSLFISKALNLEVESAKWIFLSFYFVGLIGVIIFLTFSSFYLVLKNKTIVGSIKSSARLVEKRYIETLCVILVFFVIYKIFDLIDIRVVTEIINAVFIVPYFSLVLTKFILLFDKDDV